LNASQIVLNTISDPIVRVTSILNKAVGTTAVDVYMDTIKGYGHRIFSGHDLSYLPEIYKKYGLEGVKDYTIHIGKDIMSPHGVPIPFAAEIKNALGLSTKQTLNWRICRRFPSELINFNNIIFGSKSGA